jgi:hypothetical protein
VKAPVAFALGFASCLGMIAAVGMLSRPKAQTWLVVPVASYHAPRDGYSQINPGIGLERAYSERWVFGAGYYRNSNRRDSFYAGANYTRWRIGNVRLGTSLGLVSGYGGVMPMVAPTATYDVGGAGISLIVAPPIKGTLMVGIMLRWRLE